MHSIQINDNIDLSLWCSRKRNQSVNTGVCMNDSCTIFEIRDVFVSPIIKLYSNTTIKIKVDWIVVADVVVLLVDLIHHRHS